MPKNTLVVCSKDEFRVVSILKTNKYFVNFHYQDFSKVASLNHYLATHTFHSDKIKKEYYRTIKSRKNDDWFAEINNPDHPLHDKAKVIQVFIGREDFFFCHWYAESEQVILEKLTSLGADEVIITMASKIEAPKMNKNFISELIDKIR
mgnify:CR=1 FL=1